MYGVQPHHRSCLIITTSIGQHVHIQLRLSNHTVILHLVEGKEDEWMNDVNVQGEREQTVKHKPIVSIVRKQYLKKPIS